MYESHQCGFHRPVQKLGDTFICFPVPRKGKQMQANPRWSTAKETARRKKGWGGEKTRVKSARLLLSRPPQGKANASESPLARKKKSPDGALKV